MCAIHVVNVTKMQVVMLSWCREEWICQEILHLINSASPISWSDHWTLDVATDLCEAGQGVVAVAGAHGDSAVAAPGPPHHLVMTIEAQAALLAILHVLGAELEAGPQALTRPQLTPSVTPGIPLPDQSETRIINTDQ